MVRGARSPARKRSPPPLRTCAAKYFAVPIASGGGALAIVNNEDLGKQGAQPPCLDGHKGPVLDFDFNPFHDNIIATGGDDGKVMVWGIPPGGLKESQVEPLVNLAGHQRKVVVMRFHPTAEHVVASGSTDNVIKIWDAEKGTDRTTIEHPQMILDLVWNYNGSTLLTSCKDKMVRLVDPRTGATGASCEAHDGTKTTKLEWLGKGDKFASVGFTRQSKRQLKIWDQRKLDKELSAQDIDQAAGVIMPFYDEDINVLYLAGKGDGNIRYYEMVDEEPWCVAAPAAQRATDVPPSAGNSLLASTATTLRAAAWPCCPSAWSTSTSAK
jgi:coronin-1B/1C/6